MRSKNVKRAKRLTRVLHTQIHHLSICLSMCVCCVWRTYAGYNIGFWVAKCQWCIHPLIKMSVQINHWNPKNWLLFGFRWYANIFLSFFQKVRIIMDSTGRVDPEGADLLAGRQTQWNRKQHKSLCKYTLTQNDSVPYHVCHQYKHSRSVVFSLLLPLFLRCSFVLRERKKTICV